MAKIINYLHQPNNHPPVHVSVMTLALVVALAGIGLRLVFDFEHIPNLVHVESVKGKCFDYIIIGAGRFCLPFSTRRVEK